MVRFVTITRWTPQTARALDERWNTVITGKAPKAVLDAFAKVKVIALEISMGNNLSVLVYEIEEKDLVEANIVGRYLKDVCTMETYPTIAFEDFLKVREALPMEKIPKPEQWTK
ncbi:MAG: hypothetical protein AOA66_0200 [Candidatus Bathyarchaeota archaeon BA2]|nr:MAG: hypothetical protein AOA66_0200 [Candidatus Bathyarchaeota archaeon BA2]